MSDNPQISSKCGKNCGIPRTVQLIHLYNDLDRPAFPQKIIQFLEDSCANIYKIYAVWHHCKGLLPKRNQLRLAGCFYL